MLEWLLAPIDAARVHAISPEIAWHGRLMLLGWGILCPLGVLVARFGKIWPGQDWPRELDRRTWWHAHLALQYAGSACVLAGVYLTYRSGLESAGVPHKVLGWAVVLFTVVQVLGGLLRGSKGGPTAPLPDGSLLGDHYAMTRRRRMFEYTHKTVGAVAVIVATMALATGLWTANAPRWMWGALTIWWGLLASVGIMLQKRGYAIDTYQAIWGPDPAHPGNQMPPIGVGIQRQAPDKKPD